MLSPHHAQTAWPPMWNRAADVTRVPKLKVAPLRRGSDWRERAACADVPTSVFFADGKSAEAGADLCYAKSVCTRCPVLEQCREFALESGQQYGVWGGMDEDERKREKRRRQREREKAARAAKRAATATPAAAAPPVRAAA